MPRETDSLSNTVLAELRQLGVRVPRKSKKKKEQQQSVAFNNTSLVGNIFGQPLADQDWLSDPPVPSFVNLCTSHLLHCSNVEGLLRKSGSIVRQKDLVNQLEKGHSLKWDELDPHDVGAILKQWLRALPQPVIPNPVAELLVAALRVEEQSRALRLALLLLPPENLYLLRHLVTFLKSLSRDSAHSRMDAHNLAVVMAPNLFPPATVMLQDFIAVTEALISSDLHGLPQTLAADCHSATRRSRKPSGTFTDLFNGFKKFVVKTPAGGLTATPNITPGQRCKRRANGLAVTPSSSRSTRPSITTATPLANPTLSRYKGSPHPNSAVRIRRVQKEAKQSLRRGRPNTVQSGLPRPLSLPADTAAVVPQKLQFYSCEDDSATCQSCLESPSALPTSYSDSSLLVPDAIALSETLSHSKSDYVYLTPRSKEDTIQYDSSGLNDDTRQDSLEGPELQHLTHSNSSSSYSPYPPPLCNELKFELLEEEKAPQEEPQEAAVDCPDCPQMKSPQLEQKKRRRVSLKPDNSTPPSTNEDGLTWTPSRLFNFDQPPAAEEGPSAAKRESIAQILAKNAGKVRANVQKFNNITTPNTEPTAENIFKTPAPAPRRKKLQTVLADKTNLALKL